MRNKVTLDHIQSQIVKEEDFKVGMKTTIVIITLKNGFEVIGTSSCVDPNNYDHELGVKNARLKAIDQIWFAEGYVLATHLL